MENTTEIMQDVLNMQSISLLLKYIRLILGTLLYTNASHLKDKQC
jgi:hypothetical protein